MAATNVAPESLLNYLPLTDVVTQVLADLPKPLPDAFYNQTRNVPGDQFRRFLLRPTRQVSRRAIRNSPPVRRQKTGIYVQDVKMIHTIEEIECGDEVKKLFHPYASYEPVQFGALDELDRHGVEFARILANMRLAAIHSYVSIGHIYYDADGDTLTSSSGAVEDIDALIPAGNRVTSSVDWSDPAINIPAYLTGFLNDAMIGSGGFMPVWAIYGTAVTGYLAANTSFREYLARDTGFRDTYAYQNQIANGVLGLRWVNGQSAYFEDNDGTTRKQFPVDQITFFPELTRDVYLLNQGSQPVPKAFGWFGEGDPKAAAQAMMQNPVYGPFRYAIGRTYPVLEIITVQGDNFLPDFPNPQAVWYLDVKP